MEPVEYEVREGLKNAIIQSTKNHHLLLIHYCFLFTK
jgi:hypothetical protein